MRLKFRLRSRSIARVTTLLPSWALGGSFRQPDRVWTLGAAFPGLGGPEQPTQGIRLWSVRPLGVFPPGQGRDSAISQGLVPKPPSNGGGHGASRILPDQKSRFPFHPFCPSRFSLPPSPPRPPSTASSASHGSSKDNTSSSQTITNNSPEHSSKWVAAT